MADDTGKEIQTDLSPFMKCYADGTVERLMSSPYVPPSPEDPATGVATKDVATSPAARLHLPKLTSSTDQKLPILLYFHGGGFCIGSAFSDLDHSYTNILAAAAKALVISVEYRLAPEDPLPAAYDDAWAALTWLCSHTLDRTDIRKDPWITHHGDLNKLFIGGDSAGGNIAHNILIRAGSESLPGSVKIRGAILSHPYFWGSNPIGKEPKENISEHLCYRLWDLVYPGAEKGIDSPMINPVGEGAGSLAGLGCGKLLVCLSEKDVLTGRGLAYAEKVRESGWGGSVEVEEVEEEGHCFQVSNPESERGKKLIRRMAEFVSR